MDIVLDDVISSSSSSPLDAACDVGAVPMMAKHARASFK